MRFTTYSKYKGKWLDALNLESLLEHLSDFLMDGGFGTRILGGRGRAPSRGAGFGYLCANQRCADRLEQIVFANRFYKVVHATGGQSFHGGSALRLCGDHHHRNSWPS